MTPHAAPDETARARHEPTLVDDADEARLARSPRAPVGKPTGEIKLTRWRALIGMVVLGLSAATLGAYWATFAGGHLGWTPLSTMASDWSNFGS